MPELIGTRIGVDSALFCLRWTVLFAAVVTGEKGWSLGELPQR